MNTSISMILLTLYAIISYHSENDGIGDQVEIFDGDKTREMPDWHGIVCRRRDERFCLFSIPHPS